MVVGRWSPVVGLSSVGASMFESIFCFLESFEKPPIGFVIYFGFCFLLTNAQSRQQNSKGLFLELKSKDKNIGMNENDLLHRLATLVFFTVFQGFLQK